MRTSSSRLLFVHLKCLTCSAHCIMDGKHLDVYSRGAHTTFGKLLKCLNQSMIWYRHHLKYFKCVDEFSIRKKCSHKTHNTSSDANHLPHDSSPCNFVRIYVLRWNCLWKHFCMYKMMCKLHIALIDLKQNDVILVWTHRRLNQFLFWLIEMRTKNSII